MNIKKELFWLYHTRLIVFVPNSELKTKWERVLEAGVLWVCSSFSKEITTKVSYCPQIKTFNHFYESAISDQIYFHVVLFSRALIVLFVFMTLYYFYYLTLSFYSIFILLIMSYILYMCNIKIKEQLHFIVTEWMHSKVKEIKAFSAQGSFNSDFFCLLFQCISMKNNNT